METTIPRLASEMGYSLVNSPRAMLAQPPGSFPFATRYGLGVFNVARACRSAIGHYDLSLNYIGETMISSSVQPADGPYTNNVTSIDCTDTELVCADQIAGGVWWVDPINRKVNDWTPTEPNARGIAAAGNYVYVAHGSANSTLKKIDKSTHQVVDSLSLPYGYHGQWDGFNSLWWSMFEGDQIAMIDIPSFTWARTFWADPLSQPNAGPYSIEIGEGYVYSVNNGRNGRTGSITVIDPSQPESSAQNFSLGADAAAHFGRLWNKTLYVSGANGQVVYVWDTIARQVKASIPAGQNVIGVDIIPSPPRLVTTSGNTDQVFVSPLV